MKQVVVANQKGGVGKTTAATNIATVLARTRRVLAVDIDPQFALTRQLGIKPSGVSGAVPTTPLMSENAAPSMISLPR